MYEVKLQLCLFEQRVQTEKFLLTRAARSRPAPFCIWSTYVRIYTGRDQSVFSVTLKRTRRSNVKAASAVHSSIF